MNQNVSTAGSDTTAQSKAPVRSELTASDGRTKAIADDPALLSMMVQGAQQSGPLWIATPYWQGYRDRILREIARTGVRGMRNNQILLKGFAFGGMPRPELPATPFKRAVWQMLAAFPGVRRILAEHNRVFAAEYERHKAARRNLARVAMDEVAKTFPDLKPPPGIANGGADDAFSWRGHLLVPAYAMYLTRIADFYARVPPAEVTSILEIGPGLGLSTLAHMTLNPHLRVVANVDIVPVLYLSTQFLRTIEAVDLVDYREMRDHVSISIEAPEDGLRLYQMAPWQLPKLEGQIDYFFNAFSFQEMEEEIVRNYAAEIFRLVDKGALIHSMATGHKPGAGGQRAPVTLEFLTEVFSEKWPRARPIDGFWPRLYGGSADLTRLMTK
ncbi:MAG: putative sugar O-methyltransferase [Pseudorhodoplanes sp.]|uniref:putative sugar O-methyltransferase n=1 Tax=Pseudorhodoplanes sp. TaxID=1934341 RepID=UPI003D0DEBF7